MLSWLHIGDLHLTTAGAENHRALQRIVALANALPEGSLDFVLLPGDNADNGTPAQYALLRETVAPLHLPLHILPGDHDFEPRTLDAFHQVLGARPLPYAATVKNRRCLFLDAVSAGQGGPDFRLGHDQLAWLERELDAAAAAGQDAAVFLHTYPADLQDEAAQLGPLFGLPHTLCVDMGHTHYNEVANDGGTVFMATRSTGQIEEGPVGFSITAIDGPVVSWRFKLLEEAWPFVLVTRPADARLMTARAKADSLQDTVHAKVIGDQPILSVEMQVDGGPWLPMARTPDDATLWHAPCPPGAAHLAVRVQDSARRSDTDTLDLAHTDWVPPTADADGSDQFRVEAWPERGILGTQLGPNRNGRKW